MYPVCGLTFQCDSTVNIGQLESCHKRDLFIKRRQTIKDNNKTIKDDNT